MKITLYQIDAFAEELFSGNPAAVCVLDSWLDDSLMQQIAMENNLSETAFVVKDKKSYQIRWFTPMFEVNLCGHATLASAYVLFTYFEKNTSKIDFYSHKSGALSVIKNGELLTLNFPADTIKPITPSQQMIEAMGIVPLESYEGKEDFLLIFDSQDQIVALSPDFRKLSKCGRRGVIVSAQGNTVDFVSRFFAPNCGVDEDPVTGSAHTTLIPYWSKKLGLKQMKAHQLSKRGGYLECQNLGKRVAISGNAVQYLKGEITL